MLLLFTDIVVYCRDERYCCYLQIVSFIVAMTGIIMITYVESGIASEDMWGSVLVMVGTAGAAAYKVRNRSQGHMSPCLQCRSLFVILTFYYLYIPGAI